MAILPCMMCGASQSGAFQRHRVFRPTGFSGGAGLLFQMPYAFQVAYRFSHGTTNV